MSKDPKPPKPSGDYTVGYGRPPIESRFQPGRSGNPRGRPKGKKSISRALADSLAGSVTFQEGGRLRKMPMLEFIVHRLVSDAARGDLRSVREVLALMDRFGEAQLQKGPIRVTLKIPHPRAEWKADDSDPTEQDQ